MCTVHRNGKGKRKVSKYLTRHDIFLFSQRKMKTIEIPKFSLALHCPLLNFASDTLFGLTSLFLCCQHKVSMLEPHFCY